MHEVITGVTEGTQCGMGSASGRCLIGADKPGPQEDSQRLQAVCHDSVSLI